MSSGVKYVQIFECKAYKYSHGNEVGVSITGK